MKLAQCKGCGSQFDVSSMEAGTSFICGKCGKAVEVPRVVQPVLQPMRGPQKGRQEMPATVVLTPEQMKSALKGTRETTPAQPAAKKASPKLPKAMQKRAQAKGGGTAQTRAGGAQAPPPAKKSGPKPIKARASAARSSAPSKPGPKSGGSGKKAPPASKGGASRSRDAAPPREERAPAAKKSNAGLFIAVGAIVLIGGVLGVLSMNKGGDTPSTDGTTPTTDGTGTETATTQPGVENPTVNVTPESKDQFDLYAALSSDAQRDDALQRLTIAEGDVNLLKAAHEWFTNPKLAGSSEARKAAELAAIEALKLDSSLAWARTALGKENGLELLNKLKADCALAFQLPEADEEQVDRELEKLAADPWMDRKDYSRLERLAKRVRDRHDEISKDERWAQVAQIESDLNGIDVFKDLKFIRKYEAPYVIFQQAKLERLEDGTLDPDKAHINKQRLEKAEQLASREMACFQELNRRFIELFDERFKIRGKLDEHKRLMVCVMLWDRDKFDAWNKEFGSGVGFSVRAYYSPSRQIIVHYVGDDSMRAQDQTPCEKDNASGDYRIQKQSDQVTFHEGTHQLMHEYGAIVKGMPLKWGGFAIGNFGRTMWFEEGMAEFMGATEIDEASADDLSQAKWTHNRVMLGRTNAVRHGNREMAKKWTIAALLPPSSNQDMKKASEEIAGAENSNGMINLFYARGWGLTHFLYFYDGGKYRNFLLEYLDGYFKGAIGPEAFARICGKTDPKDWGVMEDEFNWYWDQMINRATGRKINKATGMPVGWYYPETDPPEGTMEDDTGDDFDLGGDDEDMDEDE